MTKVMDMMEDFLKMTGWKYLRFDGGTKTEERALHVQQFNASQMSTRAGGLGLNLQAADTAYRIGQTRAVRILRFIKEKSVEEAMRNDEEVGKKATRHRDDAIRTNVWNHPMHLKRRVSSRLDPCSTSTSSPSSKNPTRPPLCSPPPPPPLPQPKWQHPP
ncbi:hypothetical protein CY34DRAFT_771434 [Suillus luteus UH-Slu-Lm8-n1]|uniref:Helicase C-terminal domain-containing protein n=1 Tax=Suillus luteus UH-Slu-Lm8-n1 TaxID=930992 RepID=A0A0C9ZMA4_9AGAM|nr:hypothetical protein CY34DRAFT_771434 [Suillus luteus UH-Slu-Lm8-n1]